MAPTREARSRPERAAAGLFSRSSDDEEDASGLAHEEELGIEEEAEDEDGLRCLLLLLLCRGADVTTVEDRPLMTLWFNHRAPAAGAATPLRCSAMLKLSDSAFRRASVVVVVVTYVYIIPWEISRIFLVLTTVFPSTDTLTVDLL